MKGYLSRVVGVAGLGAAVSLAAAGLGETVHAEPTPARSAAWVRSLGHSAQALTNPGGIGLDPAGNVYVTNTGNDTVAMFPAGSDVAQWTVGQRGAPRSAGSFTDPRDIAWMGGRLYVAEPGGVQVLDAADGRYLRQLTFGFKVPIGVSTGVLSSGVPALLVSDGRTGNVEVFDAAEKHVRTVKPLDVGSGTRDADTDAQGNVYVADYRNHRINKYTPTGAFVTSWDGGTNCRIPKPYGVEVDDNGRVFIASSNSNLIRVFTRDGACLRTYGRNGTGPDQLSQLRRVAVGPGPTPQVYAADLWGLKVLIYNADGTINRRIGDGTYPAAGGLNETTSVLADANAVYATDVNNHRITVWRPDGSVTTFGIKGRTPGRAAFNWPQGIGLHPSTGRIWVGDTHSNNIKEFSAFGSDTALRQFEGSAGRTLNWPGNIAVDESGNVYVAQLAGGKVTAYSASLAWKWQATVPGVQGLAWDAVNGRLIATSSAARPIVAINALSGAVTSLAATTGASATQLGVRPAGVAVDSVGRIWVGDTNKNRVVQLDADGRAAGFAFGTKGSAAGQFNRPMGLDFGPDGTLHVADSWNGRIQVFTIS